MAKLPRVVIEARAIGQPLLPVAAGLRFIGTILALGLVQLLVILLQRGPIARGGIFLDRRPVGVQALAIAGEILLVVVQALPVLRQAVFVVVDAVDVVTDRVIAARAGGIVRVVRMTGGRGSLCRFLDLAAPAMPAQPISPATNSAVMPFIDMMCPPQKEKSEAEKAV